MKTTVIVLFALASVVAFACTRQAPAVGKIDPREAEGLRRNDFGLIVDVREEDEIREGMAQGAVWMPLSKIQSRAPEWEAFVARLSAGALKDKQVIFYCRSGRRSGIAAAELASRGFRAANMGGFSDWVGAGLPTFKPTAPVPGN